MCEADSLDVLGFFCIAVYDNKNRVHFQLDTAIDKLEDDNENNDAAAVNALQALINVVEAQFGKKIPEQDATELLSATEQILELLSD